MKINKLSISVFTIACMSCLCFISTNVFAAAGSVWTTSVTCDQQETQNTNAYSAHDKIVIRASGFDPNTQYAWSITGQPASCDPKTDVAYGFATTDPDGYACVEAYTVQEDDCGVYKYDFGGKNDNYHVVGETPPPPEGTGTIRITKVVTGSCSGVNFTISVNGPQGDSPETSSLTIVCNNGGSSFDFPGLRPGTYSITESTASGWHSVNVLPGTVTVSADQVTPFTITNAPTPSSIPTLSEWGMIILSLLLAGSAIWMIRRRQSA